MYSLGNLGSHTNVGVFLLHHRLLIGALVLMSLASIYTTGLTKYDLGIKPVSRC